MHRPVASRTGGLDLVLGSCILGLGKTKKSERQVATAKKTAENMAEGPRRDGDGQGGVVALRPRREKF